MADSSFEEQVRRELDALRLKPEEQVWLNVSAALREKKKRRGFFWLLLLGMLGGAMAIYILSGRQTGNEVAEQRSKVIPVEKAPVNAGRQMSPRNTTNGGTQPDKAIEDAGQAPTINPQNSITTTPGIKVAPHVHAITMAPKFQRGDNLLRQGQALNTEQNHPDLPDANDPIAAAKVAKDEATANSSPAGTTPQSNVTDTAKPEARVDRNSSAARADTANGLPASQATTTPKARKTQASKWAWSIRAEAGIGGSVKPVSLTPSPNVYASASNPGLPGAFQGSSTAPIYHKDLYTGLALSALRKLGSKGSLGISIGYTDYRENVGVGSRYDTLLNFSNINSSNQSRFVYRPADTASFANRYQFLQLAVDYYSGFSKGSIPLRWHAGGGAAILLAGRSLHYDGNTGLMFRNDDLIPALQWFTSAGIDVGFGRKRFFAGPSFTYFLSKDSRVSTDSRHLFNATFRVGMQLGKK